MVGSGDGVELGGFVGVVDLVGLGVTLRVWVGVGVGVAEGRGRHVRTAGVEGLAEDEPSRPCFSTLGVAVRLVAGVEPTGWVALAAGAGAGKDVGATGGGTLSCPPPNSHWLIPSAPAAAIAMPIPPKTSDSTSRRRPPKLKLSMTSSGTSPGRSSSRSWLTRPW